MALLDLTTKRSSNRARRSGCGCGVRAFCRLNYATLTIDADIYSDTAVVAVLWRRGPELCVETHLAPGLAQTVSLSRR